jgi:hypothetical protein
MSGLLTRIWDYQGDQADKKGAARFAAPACKPVLPPCSHVLKRGSAEIFHHPNHGLAAKTDRRGATLK